MTEKMTIKDRMELPHPARDVYALVTDLDAVAPCLPGARLNPVAEGEPDAARTGEVVFSFGPIRYRYKGTIRITGMDPQARTVSFDAAGTETSGEGTLGVQMLLSVGEAAEAGSTLDVAAEVELTGMIADYGQGMAEEVARDIIGQFVRTVRGRDISSSPEASAVGEATATEAAPPATPKPIGGFRLLFRALFRRLRGKFRRTGK